MSDLLQLAERCEQAAGPDRELDISIAVEIDYRYEDWEEGERTAREMVEHHGLAWLVSRSVEGYNSSWRHLPRYTASLDAAMTLVPEGPTAGFRVENHPELRRKSWAEVWLDEDADPMRAASATPALALCAAALKARAASCGRNGNRQDREAGLGPKGEHAVGSEASETPKLPKQPNTNTSS